MCYWSCDGVYFNFIHLCIYNTGGNLLGVMNGGMQMTIKEILICFSQTCAAISHLHSHSPPIMNRDIKLENILMHNGVFKMCDFGSSAHSPIYFRSKEELSKMEEFVEVCWLLFITFCDIISYNRRIVFLYYHKYRIIGVLSFCAIINIV